MKDEVKKPLGWVKLYETVGNAEIVCLTYCITSPTKWFKDIKNLVLIAYVNLVEDLVKCVTK